MTQKHSTLLKTFCEWLEVNQKTEATITSYRIDIEQLFDFVEIERSLNDGTKKDAIEQFIANILNNTSISNQTKDRKINTVKQFVRFLEEKNSYSLDISFPSLQSTNERPDTIDPSQIALLRDLVKEDIDQALLIELPLQTGIRIKEMSELKMKDVLLKKRILRVNGGSNGKERKVPLNSKILNILEKKYKISKADEYVFESKNKKNIGPRNLRRKMEGICEKASIERVSPNELRNTFITSQLEIGCSLDFLGEIIGNKSKASLMRYVEVVEGFEDKGTRIVREV